MTESKTAKKMGRPPTGVGEAVTVRLHPPQIAALDEWRRHQPNPPTRPEAIRTLVGQSLIWGGASTFELWGEVLSCFKDDPNHPAVTRAVEFILARNPGMTQDEIIEKSRAIGRWKENLWNVE
jgi:hypothetical protein